MLAADPAWIEESIAGYYPHVDRIIVSFDETGTSWTGHPLDPTEAVSRLKALDHQGKIVLAPGRFFSLGRNALASDTAPVSYTHLRAHETVLDLVCRLLLEKKNSRPLPTT